MNWLRTILDGFAMTAYFNLFAAAVALYNPRLMFPCLPVGHYQGCAGTAHKSGEPLLLAVDLFWELLPLLIYGAVSLVEGGTQGFWQMALTGYIQWMMVNLCDLFFLDIFLIQKKVKRRFVIPGTEGHPGYGFKAWMKNYALPEHLLQWPLILCPLMAAVQAGLGLIMNTLRQAG